MMVTFVSQCEKKALAKTRRVLDAFANRIGDNTWQTIITQEGLLAVKKLLRKTATKNTAVSCHWIRSRSRSQFLWVVGNRSKFNEQGFVPVNVSEKNIIKSQYESDWKYLPLIMALATLAALFHDWGKANSLFQRKISPESKEKFKGDPLRHEWISCLLIAAHVKRNPESTDQEWLNDLAEGTIDVPLLVDTMKSFKKKPFSKLPPVASLVIWLILSHHRLPTASNFSDEIKNEWAGESADSIEILLKRISQQWGYESRIDEKDFQKRFKACFKFSNGLLTDSEKWLKETKKWSRKLLACHEQALQAVSEGNIRLILHHARLSMMLGDHFYSSLKSDGKWPDTSGLFANTDRKTNSYNQKLDEHLVGVANWAKRTVYLLPAFEKEPPHVTDNRSLKKKSLSPYQWQDKAVEKIVIWKKDQSKNRQGFFAVNMASTGCGKTIGNAKVMRALSEDGQSLRYILALGLRTLTLQTGDEYRNRFGLDNSELAVLIGSKAIAELHFHFGNEKMNEEEHYGQESGESLLNESIDYNCDIPEEGLATVLTREKERQLLYSPILACTIDHLISATETKRGGRYILPSLRLMSSDLVIDEIDDFNGSDLIAIGRLIHLAGMLGRKVLISSATIPPDLAEGYFNAYLIGWQLFQKSHEHAMSNIGCAWIDEFKTEVRSISSKDEKSAIKAYQTAHSDFIVKRVEKLVQQPIKRKANVVECGRIMEDCVSEDDQSRQESYFSRILEEIIIKHHSANTQDLKTKTNVSFGVVRIANIKPCVELTKYLLQADLPEDVSIRVMPYHSQQVLLIRHEQEKHLDKVLKRKEDPGKPPAAFVEPTIRTHIDSCSCRHLVFILVATPVEEVGRDHDFDWAVIEPSSFRSFIQLSGRVRRHRQGEAEKPNVAIMQYNWRAFRSNAQKGQCYFNRPGYEEGLLKLETHDLNRIVDTEMIANRLDAVPRIIKPNPLDPGNKLADLEHAVIQSLLTSYQQKGPESLQGYLSGCWYLTSMPQILNPFRKGEPGINVYRVFNEDRNDFFIAEKDKEGDFIDRGDILRIQQTDLNPEWKDRLWLIRDYNSLLEHYADSFNLSKRQVSIRFGELNFIHREQRDYDYNDQLGLVRR